MRSTTTVAASEANCDSKSKLDEEVEDEDEVEDADEVEGVVMLLLLGSD